MTEPAGAAWLDKKLPTWYKRVKEPVNIAGYTACIGGQIDGTFYDFCTKRRLTIDEAIKLGFQFRTLDPKPAQVEALNRRWQTAVDVRAAANAVRGRKVEEIVSA